MGPWQGRDGHTHPAKPGLLRFAGPMTYGHHPKGKPADDWGKTGEEQEDAVERFRQALVSRSAYHPEQHAYHSYYTLLRFLRARDYSIDKATKMWLDHLAWRQEHHVDTILDDFHFHEAKQFLQYYPQASDRWACVCSAASTWLPVIKVHAFAHCIQ